MDIRSKLAELCAAFNAHDLDRIMALFARVHLSAPVDRKSLRGGPTRGFRRAVIRTLETTPNDRNRPSWKPYSPVVSGDGRNVTLGSSSESRISGKELRKRRLSLPPRDRSDGS
jgi:hypothetical protein